MNDIEAEKLNKASDMLNGVIGRLSMHTSEHARLKEAYELLLKAARKLDDLANDTEEIGA